MRVRCRCSVFLPRVFLRFSRIQASRSLTESQPTQSLMRCSVMAPSVGEQVLENKCWRAGVEEKSCERSRAGSADHCGAKAGGPVRLVAFRSIGGRAGCALPPLAGAPPGCAGRRAGACLGAADGGEDCGVEPVVSGGNCGSAFMIVTGGIDAADGKNNPLRGVDAAGGCASPSLGPVAATTGDFAPAGQAAAWRST